MSGCPEALGATQVLDRLEKLARSSSRGSQAETAAVPSIFVDNAARPAAGGLEFECMDPSEDRPVARLSRGQPEDIESAVRSARSALRGKWGALAPQKRGEILFSLASALEASAELLAALETLDVGKPMKDSRSDVAGAAATLRYNAGAADKLQGATVPLGSSFVDFTELEPLGVTAHITPWNFPLGMAVRSVAPALAAGCTAVVKPAEQTPLTTLAFAAICSEAGFPPGTVNVVTGFGKEAGAALAASRAVDGVTFTGSVETGRLVGAAAGGALKPVVLELGGKNPLIVFEDADIGRAVDAAIEGAFENCGQVCSSVSRLLLDTRIKDAFLAEFVGRARALRAAPGGQDADLGPLASREQHAKVLAHIESALEDGASLLTGGGRPPGIERGYFVEPTVFDNVGVGSRIACEETFGPVVSAFPFQSEAEAIEIANALPYGLAAGVFTSDIDRAMRLARSLDAGTVWINGWFIGGVQAPTGGVKDSGYGRERGMAGLQNYLRIKNIGLRIAEAN